MPCWCIQYILELMRIKFLSFMNHLLEWNQSHLSCNKTNTLQHVTRSSLPLWSSVSHKSTNVMEPRFTPRNHAPVRIKSQIFWNFGNPSLKNTLFFKQRFILLLVQTALISICQISFSPWIGSHRVWWEFNRGG